MLSFINKYYSVFFIVFLVTIVGLSFYLGYEHGRSGELTAEKQIVFSCPNTILDKQQISISSMSNSSLAATASLEEGSSSVVTSQNSGAYMGSKNGTKYYTPGCPGSNRIKPENYIWFQSVEDAIVQGYSKGSC